MKKVIREFRIVLMISCIMTLITSLSLSSVSQITFSFDVLFPMGWYQKGLEASLSVWYILENFLKARGDCKSLSPDIVLGRLVFAHFCINKLVQDGSVSVSDDTAYFVMVLQRIKELLLCVDDTTQTNDDFLECAEEMVVEMANKLSLLE